MKTIEEIEIKLKELEQKRANNMFSIQMLEMDNEKIGGAIDTLLYIIGRQELPEDLQ